MRIRILAGVLAASVALVACGSDDADPGAAASTSDQLDFSATSVDGETIDASDYVGSDLVLWFWAPW